MVLKQNKKNKTNKKKNYESWLFLLFLSFSCVSLQHLTKLGLDIGMTTVIVFALWTMISGTSNMLEKLMVVEKKLMEVDQTKKCFFSKTVNVRDKIMLGMRN